MKNIKELKPVLHFKKDNYVYRYVLVDRFKHGPKYHYGFDNKEDRLELLSSLGLHKSTLSKVIFAGYNLLNLIIQSL